LQTKLATFSNNWYSPKASKLRQIFWYLVCVFFLQGAWNPFSSLKQWWLKLFGARLGKGLVLKPAINIKYPWLLSIGDHCWIGENVWIDNLVQVNIGNNVCISQGAMLLTGNHNYKKSTFDLMVGEITIEDGAWIGAQSIVCPGVTVGSHAVLSVGSVATSDLEPYTIYQGNPAQPIRKRVIEE